MGTRKNIKEIPPRQCTAMSKQNQCRCQNYAVPGFNVCRFHGANGGRIMHGMYSNKVNQSLAQRYEDFLDHTDTIDCLNSDIALMRAMMMDVLDQDATTAEEKQYQMNVFLRYMKDIRTATALKDDIEAKFAVSIQTVQIFLNQVMYILQNTIEDEAQLQAVIGRLRNVKLLDENHPQLGISKKK